MLPCTQYWTVNNVTRAFVTNLEQAQGSMHTHVLKKSGLESSYVLSGHSVP